MLGLRLVVVGRLWLAIPAGAHLPEGVVLPAFQFPAGHAPVVDGDLSDWAVVPGRYELTDGRFTDLVFDARADPSDFAVRAWVGWCEETNQLFAAAEVIDDIHQIDRPAGSAASLIWQDDDMELMVDADHSGGQYARFDGLPEDEALARTGADANHFILAGPHPDGDFFVNFSAAAWYALVDGPYTQAALVQDGEAVRYEVALKPYDQVNMVAEFLSTAHVLREGQVVGLNLEFRDFDAHSEVWDAVWSLSGGQNAFFLSERFADFRLMPLEPALWPTAVEDLSWGRIKASFEN